MRCLVSAYACEPEKGSEPGAGWNWACAASREHEVWIMTRSNNRSAIDKALKEEPKPSLRVVYLDLPPWARFWKQHGRGLRSYYLLWQILAARESRRLHRKFQFDIVHHLTFANVWLPALVCVVDAPFVLGPVGGGPRVPLRLFPALGARGMLHEVLLVTARELSRLNPLVRLSWRRANVIVCQNDETRAILPKRHRAKAQIQPNASLPAQMPSVKKHLETHTPALGGQAICAGRLVPWKGLALAIRSLVLAPGWRLLIVGEGSDKARLERLTSRLGLSSSVTFHGWCPQAELWELMRSSNVLIVPSLREDASFVTVEACAMGVPVIAFDRGGPAALRKEGLRSIDLVPTTSVSAAVDGLAQAMRLCSDSALVAPPPASEQPLFGLPATVEKLRLCMAGRQSARAQVARRLNDPSIDDGIVYMMHRPRPRGDRVPGSASVPRPRSTGARLAQPSNRAG